MKRLKRFYDTVSVSPVSDGSFQLLLDMKAVRTPLGAKLSMPSQSSADAIASEWQLQKEHIVPNTMPMTTMIMTHIDIDSKMEKAAKIDQISRFFQTDTLRFPEAKLESPLRQKQDRQWSPILDHMKAYGLSVSQTSAGFLLPEEAEKEVLRVNEFLMSYSSLQLTILETASKYTKSGSTALALVDGVIGAEDAFNAAFLEETHQRIGWGLVEGEHDIADAETILWIHGAGLLSSIVRT